MSAVQTTYHPPIGGSWRAIQRGSFCLADLNDAVTGAAEVRFFHADLVPFRPAGAR